MRVSINPTYKCDRGCSYCYLGNKRCDKTVLPLNVLHKKLTELSTNFEKIDQIDLFGGDLFQLDPYYIMGLKFLLKEFCDESHTNITINATPYKVADDFTKFFEGYNIGVSVNPERADYDYTLKWLEFTSARDLVVLTVVTEKVLEMKIEDLFNMYNNLENISRVSFIELSPSVENPVKFVEKSKYEDFLKKFIEYYDNQESKNFRLLNKEDIENCKNNNFDPTIKNGIFITPSGNYAYIKYNKEGYEYFFEVSTIQKLQKDIKKENKIYTNCCSTCENFNGCYLEHLEIHNGKVLCKGKKNLINTQ